MTYATKTTFCLNNLKILRPKVTKILQICLKNFYEFPHWCGRYFQCRKSRLCLPDFFLPPSLAHVNGLCCLLFIAEHKANLLFPAQMMIRSGEEIGRERGIGREREQKEKKERERWKEAEVGRGKYWEREFNSHGDKDKGILGLATVSWCFLFLFNAITIAINNGRKNGGLDEWLHDVNNYKPWLILIHLLQLS